MIINSNINIIGGLPDFNLIQYFLLDKATTHKNHIEFTDIRTEKSVARFKKSIMESFIVEDKELADLIKSFLTAERIENLNYLLFLIFSLNNDLFKYLNENVYFPIYFSGRTAIKKEEVLLCMKDLQKSYDVLSSWSASTLDTIASKYLTLLKKLDLVSGIQKKEILYKKLTFEDFIVFVYFLNKCEFASNKYNSDWLKYSFYEKEFFIKNLKNKKFMKFFEITFNGDNIKIKPIISYKDLYYAIKSS